MRSHFESADKQAQESPPRPEEEWRLELHKARRASHEAAQARLDTQTAKQKDERAQLVKGFMDAKKQVHESEREMLAKQRAREMARGRRHREALCQREKQKAEAEKAEADRNKADITEDHTQP